LNAVSETTFHVRYAETDKMGIVHHAAYVVWFEEGRSQWLRTFGSSYAVFEQDGVSLAVSELNARYGQPAKFDQLVTVRCWIDEVKSRKISFQYEVVDTETGNQLVRGYTRHICVDQTGKVATIPQKWREFMARHLSGNANVSTLESDSPPLECC
jgi:acyl-CoA thioester hydrolase